MALKKGRIGRIKQNKDRAVSARVAGDSIVVVVQLRSMIINRAKTSKAGYVVAAKIAPF